MLAFVPTARQQSVKDRQKRRRSSRLLGRRAPIANGSRRSCSTAVVICGRRTMNLPLDPRAAGPPGINIPADQENCHDPR